MPQIKQLLNRRLTKRETIVVIAFAAMLAGLGYLLVGQSRAERIPSCERRSARRR